MSKDIKNSVTVATYEVKKNSRLRSNFFSLIALYWFFSTYGESIAKPTILGVAILALSPMLWIAPNQIWDSAHWRTAIERSVADFLPIPVIGGHQAEIYDIIIKIVSGALVFGLLAIALRRKFERKYTR
jgi:hypothetical protein